ncbi:O-methyltransferase [Halocola ammonii]
MDFLDEKLDDYISKHTTPETEALHNLNRETHQKILQPRMLSGHVQGRFLSLISYMVRPKRILEIGTYTGYSAICLAEGLADGGILHTIDINDELEPIQDKYFAAAKMEERITRHFGDALEIIPKLDEKWDLVFIDADKTNYLNYYKLLIDKLPKNSFILADNVLWSGKVVEEVSPNDKDTRALLEFNDFVQKDDRVENVMLPLRDGVMAVRKL